MTTVINIAEMWGPFFIKKYICQINKEAEIQLLGAKTAGGNKINVIVYMSTCE